MIVLDQKLITWLSTTIFDQVLKSGSEIRNNDPWVQQPLSNIEEDRKDNTTHLGQEAEAPNKPVHNQKALIIRMIE